MATLPVLHPLLLRAIDLADKATLQMVLKSMVSSSDECAIAASQRLLVTRVQHVADLDVDDDDDAHGADAETDHNGSHARGPARKKQRRDTVISTPVSRYETCATCHKRFDTMNNAEDACQQHDGDLEIDTEYFPNDKDIQAGVEIDVNSDWRVDQWPDGFSWSCCEENAKGPPCVIQRHVVLRQL